MFEEFMDKRVKIGYRDGNQYKLGKGILFYENDTHIKLNGGQKKILVIKKTNIEKAAEYDGF